jgi:hypothetical protein
MERDDDKAVLVKLVVQPVPESAEQVPTPEEAERLVETKGELSQYVRKDYTLFRDSNRQRYVLKLPFADLISYLEMFSEVEDASKLPKRLKVPVVFDSLLNRIILYLEEAEAVDSDASQDK